MLLRTSSVLSIPIRALVWTCLIAGIVGTSDWISFDPRLSSDVFASQAPTTRGPLSIERLAAMCAPTTFTDWKDFSHRSQAFQKLPASFSNSTYNPSCSFSILLFLVLITHIRLFTLLNISLQRVRTSPAESKIPKHETEYTAPSLSFPASNKYKRSSIEDGRCSRPPCD